LISSGLINSLHWILLEITSGYMGNWDTYNASNG